jgi:hypothetical protein
MSVIDKVISAVTPLESQKRRDEARRRAREAAQPGDWLSAVLDHHLEIEAAFNAAKAETDTTTRIQARKRLMLLFNGHGNAEESVLYPALARAGEKRHASMAYAEQAAAKTEFGELEQLDPTSQDYLDKLEAIRSAVAHHMYEEEGTWLLELKSKATAEEQARIARRYHEEYERYVGADAMTTARG